jgi:hypothetical protein
MSNMYKMIVTISVVCLMVPCRAQSPTGQSLYLDAGKPYIYIAFDHFGLRHTGATDKDEPALWLRMVNNCRFPVLVPVVDLESNHSSLEVLHDVVKVNRGLKIYPDISRPPGPGNDPDKEAKADDEAFARAIPPDGYWSATSDMRQIPPGGSLLFSVPRNHVGEFWDLAVKVVIDTGFGRTWIDPRTCVIFRQSGIPSGTQSEAHTQQIEQLAHESNHVLNHVFVTPER